MPTSTIPAGDEFTLDIVAPHLEGFEPPVEPWDPQADGRLTYGIYTLAMRGARLGTLGMSRRSLGDGTVSLTVDYDKAVPGNHRQKMAAEIVCRTDAISTPLRWQFTSKTVAPGGKTIAGTRWTKSGRVVDGGLEMTDARSTRRVALPEAHTVNWALFDAVMRLPRRPFDPIHFALVDHFDQVKPAHRLSYRKTVDVVFPSPASPKTETGPASKAPRARPLRLHGYDQLGHGMVPWVWWVDDREIGRAHV